MSTKPKSNKRRANKPRKETRQLLVDLTDAEKIKYGHKLTGLIQDLAVLEAQKKRVVADYAAKISERESKLAELSNVLRDGTELREVQVLVRLCNPNPKLKTVKRLDNGVEWSEDMTDADRQLELV